MEEVALKGPRLELLVASAVSIENYLSAIELSATLAERPGLTH